MLRLRVLLKSFTDMARNTASRSGRTWSSLRITSFSLTATGSCPGFGQPAKAAVTVQGSSPEQAADFADFPARPRTHEEPVRPAGRTLGSPAGTDNRIAES